MLALQRPTATTHQSSQQPVNSSPIPEQEQRLSDAVMPLPSSPAADRSSRLDVANDVGLSAATFAAQQHDEGILVDPASHDIPQDRHQPPQQPTLRHDPLVAPRPQIHEYPTSPTLDCFAPASKSGATARQQDPFMGTETADIRVVSAMHIQAKPNLPAGLEQHGRAFASQLTHGALPMRESPQQPRGIALRFAAPRV